MKKEELNSLFVKYHDGTATEEERALLEAWYLQHNEPGPAINRHKLDAAKNLIFLKLPGNETNFPKIGLRIAAAAVLIGIIISVLLALIDTGQIASNTKLRADLPPGTNKATLTLGNGQQINLTDATNGQISNRAGIRVSKSKAGQITFAFNPSEAIDHSQNTVATPVGGQWQVKLADGTKVWLNAASKLTFPTSFTQLKSRIVTLEGEGYFEVAKDAAHPFIVLSAHQRVEVLGTHFNINSYADEQSIKTTLLEGSVKVSLLGGQMHILKPGDQATAGSQDITVEQVDTDEAVAWKDGFFQFNEEPIQSIMRKVSRWYNVDVQYKGTISKEGINGKVSRNNNISQVIDALEATHTVHLRLEGRRITVMQ